MKQFLLNSSKKWRNEKKSDKSKTKIELNEKRNALSENEKKDKSKISSVNKSLFIFRRDEIEAKRKLEEEEKKKEALAAMSMNYGG